MAAFYALNCLVLFALSIYLLKALFLPARPLGQCCNLWAACGSWLSVILKRGNGLHCGECTETKYSLKQRVK